MALRIPVNPQTSPASEVVPYNPASKAVDVSGFAKGLESLGNSLDQLHAKQVEAQKQSDAFDLNTKFLSTINDREQDFQARKTDPNLNVNGFVGQVNQDYTKQDQDLIAQAQAAGYDKNAVREFALKLGTSTNSFLRQSLEFQHQSQRANASTNVDGLIDQGSRYVVQNPNDIEGTLGEINHTIDLNPFLTPDERAVKKDQARAQITGTAGQAFTEQNPQAVLDHLGQHFVQKGEAAVPSGQSANPWANVAVNVAQHFGLDPAELGGIMSFESGLNPQATNASGHLGLIQFGKAEQQKYNVNAQSSPADWTKAITSFFQDRGLKKGANIMDVYSTILTGRPGNYDAADSNGTTVRNAVPRILQDHVPKAQAWIGQLAPPVDNNFHPPEGQTSYKALTPPMQQVDPDTGQPINGPQNLAPQGSPLNPEPVKTGIPALDNLTGAQQLQMIAHAQGLVKERDSQDKALADTQVDNAIAAMKQGLPPGYVPSQEELQRLHGSVQGANIQGQLDAYKTAQPIIAGMKTANSTVLQQQVTALKPLNPNDPDFAKKQAVWQAVNEAAVENLRQRQEDPAAYLMQAFPNITKQLAGAKTLPDQQAAYKAQVNAYQQLGVPQDQWSPVTKEQAGEIAQQYAHANPETRLNILNQWFGGLPRSMIKPFVTAMANTSQQAGASIGRDAFLYSTLVGHPEFTTVMRDAMAGSEAQADSARRITADQADRAWRRMFPTNANSMNPLASENYKQVAMDLYVNAGGKVPQGPADVLDLNLWEKSVRRAVGGLANNADTGFFAEHGRGSPMTILPPSVTKQEFQHWTDTLTGNQLSQLSGGSGAYTKFGLPSHTPVLVKDIQNHGTFVMRAPGSYAIQFPDGGTLLNNHGDEYIIHITPQTVRGR